jgi:lysozyme family protein
MTFDEAFKALIGHEGSYSNHPDDPGKETMYGITHDTARRNGYFGDMRALPLETAKKIAKREYWDAVSADSMPAAIRFDLFDGAYNSGPTQAIKWLQRAVYAHDDGIVGPRTLMAANTYSGAAIAARYNGHRLQMLSSLKTWASFGRGWANRVAKNLIETKG